MAYGSYNHIFPDGDQHETQINFPQEITVYDLAGNEFFDMKYYYLSFES